MSIPSVVHTVFNALPGVILGGGFPPALKHCLSSLESLPRGPRQQAQHGASGVLDARLSWGETVTSQALLGFILTNGSDLY